MVARLAYVVTGCISLLFFVSLFGVPIGTTSSAIGLKVCAQIAGIKRHRSIIVKKKKNKHDRIVLLAKSKLNSREFLRL